MSTTPTATRRKGRPKGILKPKFNVTLDTRIVEKAKFLAEERGESFSAFCQNAIREVIESPPSVLTDSPSKKQGRPAKALGEKRVRYDFYLPPDLFEQLNEYAEINTDSIPNILARGAKLVLAGWTPTKLPESKQP